MITLSIMMANIMQGVDNSILNVALPHIQGSLFRENAIDNALLPELTDDDLKDLGVSLIATDLNPPVRPTGTHPRLSAPANTR